MKNNLKLIRQEKGLTQVQIAEKANITTRSYQRIEKGTQEPKIITAQLIAQTLNTTVENLFPLSQVEEKHNLTT